jgi:hypothetical protein
MASFRFWSDSSYAVTVDGSFGKSQAERRFAVGICPAFSLPFRPSLGQTQRANRGHAEYLNGGTRETCMFQWPAQCHKSPFCPLFLPA